MFFPLFSCQLLFQMSGSLSSWCRNINSCMCAVQLLCKGVHGEPALIGYNSRVIVAHAHQLCETTEALSQDCSGPPNSLWQPPAGSLSHTFSNRRQIAFGPSSSACLLTHFRDFCAHTITAMLWCTALGGICAISGWGRYRWYHTPAGWLTQPCKRLPPCCKAHRIKCSLVLSLCSLVLVAQAHLCW